jgi:hypothetical protein
VTDSTSVVLLMVRDAYANYVVQTTLDVVPESNEKVMLLEELNAHSEELVSSATLLTSSILSNPYYVLQRQYTFAKHIVAKLLSLRADVRA